MWNLELPFIIFFFFFLWMFLKTNSFFMFLVFFDFCFLLIFFFFGLLKPSVRLKKVFLVLAVLSVVGATIGLSILVSRSRREGFKKIF